MRLIRRLLFSPHFMILIKSLGTLEAGQIIMRRTEALQSRISQLLMETSCYVSATQLIRRYLFGSVPNNFQVSRLYNSGIFVVVLIGPMRSMIRVDNLFGSTDITISGLFGGVVKGIATISNILLFAVWCLPPSDSVMFKDTANSEYSMAFS